MGCFDTVHINCPSCNARVKIQTKTGTCRLRHYRASNVPVEAANGALGDERCDNCSKTFTVKARTPRIELYAVPQGERPSDEDDEEEFDDDE